MNRGAALNRGAGMNRNAAAGRAAAGMNRAGGVHPGGMSGGAAGHANRSGSFSNPSYASRFGGREGGMGERAGAGRIGAGVGNVGNRTGIANRNFSGNTFNVGNRNVNLAGAGYHPSYYNHGFYHGYWNGHYGLGWGWGRGYWWRPWYWGYGAWGLGMLAYESGYYNYYNPYYSSGFGTTNVYNYSQPIPVAYNTPGAAPAEAASPAQPTDDDELQPAIDAFKKNSLDRALDLVNALIKKKATDAVFHEFRALVLFARGDYQEAAATIHSVLALGPGWDWTTLSHLYGNLDDYRQQLANLEDFVKQHDKNGSAHFLLAYHYLTAGRPDPAVEQLQKVVKLVPEDKVAADLLKMLSPPENQVAAAEAPSPGVDVAGDQQAAPPAAPPVEASALQGGWKATGQGDSKFDLALGGDGRFKWSYSQKARTFTFEGTWQIDGDLLTLERKDGGSMIGKVRLAGDHKSFKLKMLGEPDEDPGLTFQR